MDTLIGSFDLTPNQVANFIIIDPSPFKGFMYMNGQITAVSIDTPSEADIKTLADKISALPETLDKKVYESRFDIEKMTARFGDAFSGITAINLAPYLEAFRSYARGRNFKGMKDFRDGLVALGKCTTQDAYAITSVILEQGIDLNSY